MSIQLLKKAQLQASRWAGGTTTQLAIFPCGSEYSEFNFTFRISFATVEVEESTFTFMPGVMRHLLILDGSLFIDHTGKYSKQLSKFDQDVFNGEWPTTAKGRVTDFNLMTKGKASGKIHAEILGEGEKLEIPLGNELNYAGIFSWKGNLEINEGGETFILEERDFALVDAKTLAGSGSLTAVARGSSELIIAEVSCGAVDLIM